MNDSKPAVQNSRSNNFGGYSAQQSSQRDRGSKPEVNRAGGRESTSRYGKKHDDSETVRPLTESRRYYTSDYVENKKSPDAETAELATLNSNTGLLKDISSLDTTNNNEEDDKYIFVNDNRLEKATHDQRLDKQRLGEKVGFSIENDYRTDKSRRMDHAPGYFSGVNRSESFRESERIGFQNTSKNETLSSGLKSLEKLEFTPTNSNRDLNISELDIAKYIGPQKNSANKTEFKDDEGSKQSSQIDAPKTRRVKPSKTHDEEDQEEKNAMMSSPPIHTLDSGDGSVRARRVSRKPHQTTAEKDETAYEAVKLEMQRENPKNRTLFDPNNPAPSIHHQPVLLNTPPSVEEASRISPHESADIPSFQDLQQAQRPHFRQPLQGRSLYDPNSMQASAPMTSAANNLPCINSIFPNPSLQNPPLMSNVTVKPTAQVMPIPSTSAPPVQNIPTVPLANPIPLQPSHEQFMGFLRMWGMDQSQQTAQSMTAIFPVFMQFFQLFNSTRNLLAQSQQPTSVPQQPSNMDGDFLQFLTGQQQQMGGQFMPQNSSLPSMQPQYQQPASTVARNNHSITNPYQSTTSSQFQQQQQYQYPFAQQPLAPPVSYAAQHPANIGTIPNTVQEMTSQNPHAMMNRIDQVDYNTQQQARSELNNNSNQRIESNEGENSVHAVQSVMESNRCVQSSEISGAPNLMHHGHSSTVGRNVNRAEMELKLEVFPNRVRHLLKVTNANEVTCFVFFSLPNFEKDYSDCVNKFMRYMKYFKLLSKNRRI